MAKVIVERPRLGPRRSSRRPFWEKNYNIDDLPSKLGVRMRHVATFEQRTLNENLSPLKRYLAKQVGRPWNCVYRDICASLRPTSAVQQHVRQHVWDYVARYVSIAADSSVHNYEGPFRTILPSPLRAGTLYIHPTNGLLLRVRKRRAS